MRMLSMLPSPNRKPTFGHSLHGAVIFGSSPVDGQVLQVKQIGFRVAHLLHRHHLHFVPIVQLE